MNHISNINKIEELLEKPRLNCVYRENIHRKQFYYYKCYKLVQCTNTKIDIEPICKFELNST